MPQTATGAGLGAELPGEAFGKNILLPRAAEGEEGLAEVLITREATVDAVTAYANVLDGAGAEEVRERLAEGTVDVVTFTSSSTVKNFVTALGGVSLPETVKIACIGPSTAKTATELLGRAPEILADEPTMAGLLAALEGFYARQG